MPFKKIKGKTVFIALPEGKLHKEDLDLLGKGFSLIDLEADSNLSDEILKDNLVDLKSGTKNDLLVLKHRPDLIKLQDLKKFTVLGNINQEQRKEIFG